MLPVGGPVHAAPAPVEVLWQIPTDASFSNMSNFAFGGSLGRGSQSIVRKFQCLGSGRIYAVKSTVMEQRRDHVMRELHDAFKGLEHQNVVKIFAIFVQQEQVHLVMEYMNFGHLGVLAYLLSRRDLIPADFEGIVPEWLLSCLTRQILAGLLCLHKKKIIHRDINPTNLLLNSEGVVKIADFGRSKELFKTSQLTTTRLGSEAYMSPERVRGEPHNYKADIWGVGLCVAHCALGVFPLSAPGEQRLTNGEFHCQPANIFNLSSRLRNNQATVDFSRIIEQIGGRTDLRRPSPPSDALKHFVSLSMSQRPEERPPCMDLLNHQFIRDHLSVTSRDVQNWLVQHNLRNLAKAVTRAT
eukprot:RCo048936